MQPQFSCTPSVLNEIETSISSARLERYLTAARGDRQLALRLYLWNARLCQELYVPIQHAELAVRNAISGILIRRFGAGWYSNYRLIDVLPDRHKDGLATVVHTEQLERGSGFTGNNVVAGMTFGFWSQLLTRNFKHILWQPPGIHRAFSHAPPGMHQHELHESVEQVRLLRNDVAHHSAVFDRRALARYQNAMDVIGWVSPATQWLVREIANPQAIMADRPTL